MAAERPGVLVEGARRHPAVLGPQPHLQVLPQHLGLGAGSALDQRPLLGHRRPLGGVGPELAHPAAPGGGVVAALADDPLAPLPVDLRLPHLDPLHRPMV